MILTVIRLVAMNYGCVDRGLPEVRRRLDETDPTRQLLYNRVLKRMQCQMLQGVLVKVCLSVNVDRLGPYNKV